MLSPGAFAYKHLGQDPYDWQLECLEAIGRRQKVALRAANGSGKTDVVVAASILWFLHTFPKGRCVVTSSVFRQVKEQIWRALEGHKEMFPDWTWTQCMIRTPEGGFALGFATDDAGRAEGWHTGDGMEFVPGWDEALANDDWEAALDLVADNGSEPLYFVADECKSIKDDTFTAIDRCQPTFRLYCSSPGAAAGKFFRCFHRERRFHYCVKVTSSMCPHIPPELIEEHRATYGADSPEFLSMHEAEFMEDGGMIMTRQAIEKALENQPLVDTSGEMVGFCDFAAGGDENVFAIRVGNRVRIVDAWRDKDTTRARKRFIQLFRENGLNPGDVWGDADGMGAVIINDFRDDGFPLVEFRGGLSAPDMQEGRYNLKDRYDNLISFVWIDGCRQIRNGEVNIQSEGELLDETTIEQITTRPQMVSSKGKLQAMPKDKMKSDLSLGSPDRGDAILGVIVCGKRLTGAIDALTADLARVQPNAFAAPRIAF